MRPSESTITDLFNVGQIDEVIFRSSRELVLNPQAGFFWKALGTAMLRHSMAPNAARMLWRALLIDGNDQYAWMARAVALFELGRCVEARRHHFAGLVIGPDEASAYRNCGVVNTSVGNAALACVFYKRLTYMTPADASAWTSLGAAAMDAGHSNDALGACQRAICIDPNLQRGLGMLGVLLQQRGKNADSRRFHSRAINSGAYEPTVFGNFGAYLVALHEFEESEYMLLRALSLQPGSTKWLSSLAIVRREQGHFFSALTFSNRAISADPLNAAAIDCLGTTLRQCGRHDIALVYYQKALVMNPAFVEALTNTGNACFEMHDSSRALWFLDRAFVTAPGNPASRWNASLICLAIGDFARGWDLHEYRFAAGAVRAASIKGLPPFNFNTAANSVVLITPEQGLGDELMFCTLVPKFREFVGSVVVQADSRLVPLLRRSFPSGIQVLANSDNLNLTGLDAQISAGSLGRYVWASRDDRNVDKTGFLVADRGRVLDFCGVLNSHGSGPWLGISWKCANKDSAAIRNIQLAVLWQTVKSLFPDVRFVSLQYGSVDKELEEVNFGSGANILSIPNLNITTDLDGTAALVCACDAVITIGNTTAHLAGALGKPAAVLLPFSPSWRWMLEGNNSVWYRSLRLYRKDQHGADWRTVIRAAAQGLTRQLSRAHRRRDTRTLQ